MSECILVTGGAGFIGSHVVEKFVEAGYRVAIVDNLSTGKRVNVHPEAAFYEIDIRDAAALERVFVREQPAGISHQAALANVRDSLMHPEAYAAVNVIGTLHLLKLAHQYGVKKVIMASTGGAIYGDQTILPTHEECPAHPLDPYGVSKLACEHYLFSFRHNYGLDYCALRYGNVYGPRQNPYGEAGVVAIYTQKMLNGEAVVINGDGKQQRDFVYAGDVARANLLALRWGSGIYNIGTGIPTDINTVFRSVARLTKYSQAENHGPQKPGEVRVSCLDSGKANRELQWNAEVSLEDGLAQTMAWYRESSPVA